MQKMPPMEVPMFGMNHLRLHFEGLGKNIYYVLQIAFVHY